MVIYSVMLEVLKTFWKTKPYLILLIVIASLAFVLFLLFSGLPLKDHEPVSIQPVVASSADYEVIDVGSLLAGADELWYYDAGLDERYAAFASLRPELSVDEIVWMVAVNLDLPPYSETSEIADPESITALITKYWYLPEEYAPADLVSAGQSMMRGEAAESMNEMIKAAREEGHRLWVQSGYRSFGLQAELFEKYAQRDGEEAAEYFSARAGHSEHQSGLTADLNTITDAFGTTREGIWAAENCWRYGFIVRYTAENTEITLYKPEPWHMRYIGRDAAEEMYYLGIPSFEEYWVKYIKYNPES